ncbi:COPII coat assembly protein SEC16 [Smittium culicis]|uniref:Protein transport protein sec16 n=1 Tax=Smittium culicis TaxID=133412 RepID=A0A1R1Y1V6_9FUNG|nr:COPII coat assembly protein SEC16 [Smittium culicis]
MAGGKKKSANKNTQKKSAADEPIPFFQSADDSSDFFSTVIAESTQEVPSFTNNTHLDKTLNSQNDFLNNTQTTLDSSSTNFFDNLGSQDDFSQYPNSNPTQIDQHVPHNPIQDHSNIHEKQSFTYDPLDQNISNNNFMNYDTQFTQLQPEIKNTDSYSQDWPVQDPSVAGYTAPQIVYDETSGQYYDQITGHYYDPDYQQFFNEEIQEWYYYDESGFPVSSSSQAYAENYSSENAQPNPQYHQGEFSQTTKTITHVDHPIQDPTINNTYGILDDSINYDTELTQNNYSQTHQNNTQSIQENFNSLQDDNYFSQNILDQSQNVNASDNYNNSYTSDFYPQIDSDPNAILTPQTELNTSDPIPENHTFDNLHQMHSKNELSRITEIKSNSQLSTPNLGLLFDPSTYNKSISNNLNSKDLLQERNIHDSLSESNLNMSSENFFDNIKNEPFHLSSDPTENSPNNIIDSSTLDDNPTTLEKGLLEKSNSDSIEVPSELPAENTKFENNLVDATLNSNEPLTIQNDIAADEHSSESLISDKKDESPIVTDIIDNSSNYTPITKNEDSTQQKTSNELDLDNLNSIDDSELEVIDLNKSDSSLQKLENPQEKPGSTSNNESSKSSDDFQLIGNSPTFEMENISLDSNDSLEILKATDINKESIDDTTFTKTIDSNNILKKSDLSLEPVALDEIQPKPLDVLAGTSKDSKDLPSSDLNDQAISHNDTSVLENDSPQHSPIDNSENPVIHSQDDTDFNSEIISKTGTSEQLADESSSQNIILTEDINKADVIPSIENPENLDNIVLYDALADSSGSNQLHIYKSQNSNIIQNESYLNNDDVHASGDELFGASNLDEISYDPADSNQVYHNQNGTVYDDGNELNPVSATEAGLNSTLSEDTYGGFPIQNDPSIHNLPSNYNNDEYDLNYSEYDQSAIVTEQNTRENGNPDAGDYYDQSYTADPLSQTTNEGYQQEAGYYDENGNYVFYQDYYQNSDYQADGEYAGYSEDTQYTNNDGTNYQITGADQYQNLDPSAQTAPTDYQDSQYTDEAYTGTDNYDSQQYSQQNFDNNDGGYTDSFMPLTQDHSSNPNYFYQNDLVPIQSDAINRSLDNSYYNDMNVATPSDPILEQRLNSGPIVSFGFGGTMVSVFPNSNLNSPSAPQYNHIQQTSKITVHKISDLIPIQFSALPDSDHFVFDGRLGKDDVLNSINMASNKCDIEIKGADVTSSWKMTNKTSSDNRNDQNNRSHLDSLNPTLPIDQKLYKKLIWLALGCIIDNKYLSEQSDKGRLQLLIKSLKSIGSNNGNKENGNTTGSDTISQLDETDVNENSISSNFGDSNSISELESLLLKGNRLDAVNYAISKNLWTHALIISTCVSPEVWQSTVLKYTLSLNKSLTSQFVNNPTKSKSELHALGVQYRLFSGLKADSLSPNENSNSLLPVSPHKDPVNRTAGANESEDWNELWVDTLSMILANYASGYNSAIHSLGNKLIESSNFTAAQICYLLSMSPSLTFQKNENGAIKYPLVGTPFLAGERDRNRPNLSHSKSLPISHLPWDRFTELSLMWTEIFEVSQIIPNLQKLNSVNQAQIALRNQKKIDNKEIDPVLKKPQVFIPHLQTYKISYALWLIDCGYNDLAFKYCDSVLRILQFEPWDKHMEHLRFSLISNIKDLQVRLINIGVSPAPYSDMKTKDSSYNASSSQSASNKNWLKLSVPKPSLSSIFNAFDSSIDKLISGPSTNSPNKPGTPINGRTSLDQGYSDSVKSSGSDNNYPNKLELGPDRFSVPADFKSSKVTDKSFSGESNEHLNFGYKNSAYNNGLDRGYLERANSSSTLQSMRQLNSGASLEPDTQGYNTIASAINGPYSNQGASYPNTYGSAPSEANRADIHNSFNDGLDYPSNDKISNIGSGRNSQNSTPLSAMNQGPYNNFSQFAIKNNHGKSAQKRMLARNKYAIDPKFDLAKDKDGNPQMTNNASQSSLLPRPSSLMMFNSEAETVDNSSSISSQNLQHHQNSADNIQNDRTSEAINDDQEDDFLGFGNKSLKKKPQGISSNATSEGNGDNTLSDSRSKTAKADESNNDAKSNNVDNNDSSKSQSKFGLNIFKGLFWSRGSSGDGKSGVQADLGEKSSFVYDPVEKRWINKSGKSDDKAQGSTGSLPPPPRFPPPPPKTSIGSRVSTPISNFSETGISNSAPPLRHSLDQTPIFTPPSRQIPPTNNSNIGSIQANIMGRNSFSGSVNTSITNNETISNVQGNYSADQITEGSPESFSSFSSYAVTSRSQSTNAGNAIPPVISPTVGSSSGRISSPLAGIPRSGASTPIGAGAQRPAGKPKNRSARNKYVDVFNQSQN